MIEHRRATSRGLVKEEVSPCAARCTILGGGTYTAALGLDLVGFGHYVLTAGTGLGLQYGVMLLRCRRCRHDARCRDAHNCLWAAERSRPPVRVRGVCVVACSALSSVGVTWSSTEEQTSDRHQLETSSYSSTSLLFRVGRRTYRPPPVGLSLGIVALSIRERTLYLENEPRVDAQRVPHQT